MSVQTLIWKNKSFQQQIKPAIPQEIQAYEIILEKKELYTENIPYYLQLLKEFESQSSKEARYIEAEMSQRKQQELKHLLIKEKQANLMRSQIKEKISLEDQYQQEIHELENYWENLHKKMVSKIEQEKTNLKIQHEKQQEQLLRKIDEQFQNQNKDNSLQILELQKIEKTLAKQKNYMEAQRIREQWLKIQSQADEETKQEITLKKQQAIFEFDFKKQQDFQKLDSFINDLKEQFIKNKANAVRELQKKYEWLQSHINIHQNNEKVKRQVNQLSQQHKQKSQQKTIVIQQQNNSDRDFIDKEFKKLTFK